MWLRKNKRVTLRFTPAGASWVNLVKSFFSVITRQAIRRGTFASVGDLVEAIDVHQWVERAVRAVQVGRDG